MPSWVSGLSEKTFLLGSSVDRGNVSHFGANPPLEWDAGAYTGFPLYDPLYDTFATKRNYRDCPCTILTATPARRDWYRVLETRSAKKGNLSRSRHDADRAYVRTRPGGRSRWRELGWGRKYLPERAGGPQGGSFRPPGSGGSSLGARRYRIRVVPGGGEPRRAAPHCVHGQRHDDAGGTGGGLRPRRGGDGLRGGRVLRGDYLQQRGAHMGRAPDRSGPPDGHLDSLGHRCGLRPGRTRGRRQRRELRGDDEPGGLRVGPYEHTLRGSRRPGHHRQLLKRPGSRHAGPGGAWVSPVRRARRYLGCHYQYSEQGDRDRHHQP